MCLLQKSCSVLEPNACMPGKQCVVTAWEMSTAGHSNPVQFPYFWGGYFFLLCQSLS